jgi:hypothetical protein
LTVKVNVTTAEQLEPGEETRIRNVRDTISDGAPSHE